jgi:DNA-binding GntR family transcriptional regulator
VIKAIPRHVELAKQIVGRARREGWALRHHLTESSLVEAFQVSRSPVRAALKLLAEQGILQAERHRGYFLAVDQEDLARVHLEVPLTDVEMVYSRLIEDRMSGALSGEIHQKSLLARYNVTRPQLLSAIERMESEGLLVRNRSRGRSFLPVIEDLRSEEASLDFRLMVEPSSILLAGFSVDYEALVRMRHSHLDLKHNIADGHLIPTQVFEVDAVFHQTIAGFSNNSFVIQAIQHHNHMRRVVEYRGYGDGKRIAAWIPEHLRVIDALERHRYQIAAEHMATHLKNGKTYSKLKL